MPTCGHCRRQRLRLAALHVPGGHVPADQGRLDLPASPRLPRRSHRVTHRPGPPATTGLDGVTEYLRTSAARAKATGQRHTANDDFELECVII